VVGVKSGGVKNLIKDGVNGYLAEPNNVEDIADKVAALIENQDLRNNLGEMARKKVLDRSWDNVNGRLLESYSELVGLSPADDISSFEEAEEEELVPTDTF
jgi:glycosyltransferase involved in cell wall biosynthesis